MRAPPWSLSVAEPLLLRETNDGQLTMAFEAVRTRSHAPITDGRRRATMELLGTLHAVHWGLGGSKEALRGIYEHGGNARRWAYTPRRWRGGALFRKARAQDNLHRLDRGTRAGAAWLDRRAGQTLLHGDIKTDNFPMLARAPSAARAHPPSAIPHSPDPSADPDPDPSLAPNGTATQRRLGAMPAAMAAGAGAAAAAATGAGAAAGTASAAAAGAGAGAAAAATVHAGTAPGRAGQGADKSEIRVADIAIIDWELSGRGPPGRDLVSLLSSNFAPGHGFSPEAEEALVRAYHEALRAGIALRVARGETTLPPAPSDVELRAQMSVAYVEHARYRSVIGLGAKSKGHALAFLSKLEGGGGLLRRSSDYAYALAQLYPQPTL
jgi:thiamine kinase-like enzyme